VCVDGDAGRSLNFPIKLEGSGSLHVHNLGSKSTKVVTEVLKFADGIFIFKRHKIHEYRKIIPGKLKNPKQLKQFRGVKSSAHPMHLSF